MELFCIQISLKRNTHHRTIPTIYCTTSDNTSRDRIGSDVVLVLLRNGDAKGGGAGAVRS